MIAKELKSKGAVPIKGEYHIGDSLKGEQVWMNYEMDYQKFRINIEELTGDLALIIVDFAEPEEKEDSIYLWDSQINDLKRLLGI